MGDENSRAKVLNLPGDSPVTGPASVPSRRPTVTLRAKRLARESNKTSQRRIRRAVVSGFNVPAKPIFEAGIASDRDDQVVPTIEGSKLQLVV